MNARVVWWTCGAKITTKRVVAHLTDQRAVIDQLITFVDVRAKTEYIRRIGH
jgi:hypothetical protein